MQNLEETLREVCCLGDLEKVKLLVGHGVNVNSQNKVNGWTGLHWAAKRNHKHVVSYLLNNGADLSICTFEKELALELTQSKDIKKLLAKIEEESAIGVNRDDAVGGLQELPAPVAAFVPNYVQYPQFPYSESAVEFAQRIGIQLNATTTVDSSSGFVDKDHFFQDPNSKTMEQQEQKASTENKGTLVLKFRIAEAEEEDFIEIELDRKCSSFSSLVDACLTEFGVDKSKLKKIRKLPNTIVRNDRDVKRLTQFQEMEIILE